MARRKRGRASEARHALRELPTLARDAKHAERIGGRARIGGGLTDRDADAWQRRAYRARTGDAGRVLWRATRRERAADALVYSLIGRELPAHLTPERPERTGAHLGTATTTTPAPRERAPLAPPTREELAAAIVRVLCVDYGFVATLAALTMATTNPEGNRHA